MADLSKITLPNGDTYDLKDAAARAMTGFYVGTCATAAGIKDKVVTLTDATGFELKAGVVVAVKFTYSNTYSSTTASPVTLNVNSTGAKNIWFNVNHSGASNTGTNNTAYGTGGRYIFYVYDGSYWCWINHTYDNDTNYHIPSTVTAAGKAAKVVYCTYYTIAEDSYIPILFQNTNTATSALTLNINSQGAKPLWINGKASSSSNHTLPRGTYIVYYDGTNYYLRTDGKLPIGGIDVIPTLSKTYTGVIATANNQADGNLYGIKILPDDYDGSWSIFYKVTATIAGVSEANGSGYQESYVYIDAMRDVWAAYRVWNNIRHTSYRPIYYHTFYRAKSAGITNGYGHVIGVGLRSSWNPTTAANSRTITFEILDHKNCTVSFFDSMTKYASIPGIGSTNYAGLSEFDGITQGCTQSGDRNDLANYINSPYTHFKAGAGGIRAYSIILQDGNGTWQSVHTTNSTTAANKVKNSAGFRLGQVYYVSSGSNWASGGVVTDNVIRSMHAVVDARYSFNIDTNDLTGNKEVYLVGELHSDGLFYLDSPWWTQIEPTSDDGKVYIPVGYSRLNGASTYQMDFRGWHGAYWYKNGCFQEVVLSAVTVNGHAIGHDEDENVVVAWDGGEVITSPSGTALAISQGGTGATTAAAARTNLGLGSAATYNVVSTVNDDSNLVTGAAIKSYYEAVGIPSAISTTSAATAAKVATCSSFKLLANSYIQVILANANTANSALTLNINSTGAKPIVINGTTSSSSNKTLPAGSYFVFYNGTNYYFRTDGKLTGDITGNAETVNNHTVEKDVPSDAKFTDTTALASMTGSLPVSKGGTGATTESAARTNLGVVAKGGDTMTGQLKTSFKQSVAIGSVVSSSSTIPDLCEEMKVSSGCMGSVYITTAYTNGDNTASTGWYNYIWIPHRSGGINGAANGDATRYGNLILLGMTMNGGYTIRYDNGTLTMHKLF